MATTETFSINSSITARDNSGLNRPFIKNILFTFVGTLVEYNNGLQVPTSPATSLILPANPANIVYIRNIGTTTITVTWTPNSGSSNIVVKLVPLGFIMMGEAATGQGVTAISVQSATSQGTIEYVLG
jgi:hypothetical protein